MTPRPAVERRRCPRPFPCNLILVVVAVLVALATNRVNKQVKQIYTARPSASRTSSSIAKINREDKKDRHKHHSGKKVPKTPNITEKNINTDKSNLHVQTLNNSGKERPQTSKISEKKKNMEKTVVHDQPGDKTHVRLRAADEKIKIADSKMKDHVAISASVVNNRTRSESVKKSKISGGAIKRYPRLARFKVAGFDKKPKLLMLARVGVILEETYVGDQSHGSYSISPSENITQRYMPSPKVSSRCSYPIHAQPSCNIVHSVDVAYSLQNDLFRKISKGDVRNVWSVLETHKRRRIHVLWEEQRVSFVIKTLRWARDFLSQTYKLQQKEAVALDYLSHTPGITKTYGFCGMTSLNSYANLGDMTDFLKRRLRISKNVSPAEFLAIAARLARSVAGMQSRESSIMGSGYKGNVSLRVIHRDIGASNVLLSQGKRRLGVQLDDFNKAYILRRYEKSSSPQNRMCTYQERFICGGDGRRPDTRSPEECRENQSLTYKVDTYGLGTVFFYLLTQNRVHNLNSDSPGPADEHVEWYRDRVKRGEEPEIPRSIASMSNKAVIAIINGMRMSMTPDPKKRPSATEIADFLDDQYWKYVEESMSNETIRRAVKSRIQLSREA